MSIRDLVLAQRAAVTSFEFEGATFYVKALTVADKNRVLYGQRCYLVKLAEAQGIELDLDNEEQLKEQAPKIYDQYAIPRLLASRLCDADGKLQFDAENQDDLDQLATVSEPFLNAFMDAYLQGEPKNSPTAEDSK